MMDINYVREIDLEQFLRICAVFKIGGGKLGDGYGYLTQHLLADEEAQRRSAANVKIRDGENRKARDLTKGRVRVALLKHFYADTSKEERRLANLQVDVMMEMLQESVDPPDLLNAIIPEQDTNTSSATTPQPGTPTE